MSDTEYSSGRRGIDSQKRGNPSKRAIKGDLIVEKRTCPYCGHHKILQSVTLTKCAKCKRKIIFGGR